MAFYDYIILNGYRYKTLAKQWRPSLMRPATPRMTLGGEYEATFGKGIIQRWEGIIAAPHGDFYPEDPGDGTAYGNIVSLRGTLTTDYWLDLTDHYGRNYVVVSTGPFEETMLQNIWNAPSNKYYVRAVLTSTYAPP